MAAGHGRDVPSDFDDDLRRTEEGMDPHDHDRPNDLSLRLSRSADRAARVAAGAAVLVLLLTLLLLTMGG